MKIYVGNMPYAMTEDELRSVFEAHGNVASASLAIDRETRRPRGFGFVEMPDAAEANAAIAALNGAEQGGRKLVVNEALVNGAFHWGKRNLVVAIVENHTQARGLLLAVAENV